MRHLVLLRGAPASGKSTWIKENNLEQYTLSADKIRLMFQSPVLNINGNLCITQTNDTKVWELIFKLLEDRMERGEFTIIDATHSRIDMITRYRKLAERYRYRIYIVDFQEELETLLERNKNREEINRVPEGVIKNAHERIKCQQPQGYAKVIKKEDFCEIFNKGLIYDYNEYKKIVVIGDIHGCFEPLKQYFEGNPFNEETMYIFIGDYIDRGIQNIEVLNYLKTLLDKKNVLLLEGNHERWLAEYAYSENDDWKNTIKSKESIKTFIQLEADGYNKSLARELYRKLGQFAYFDFYGKKFLITHGGLSNVPTIFTSNKEMIFGVGKYENTRDIAEAFYKNTNPEDILQIHGHRNIYLDPVSTGKNTYNLCDEIEFGGNLRILEIKDIDIDLEFHVIQIKNEVYNKEIRRVKSQIDSETLNKMTDEEIVKTLLLNNHIIKKDQGNDIYSLNFDRDCFYDKIWNSLTTKARGLFVNMKTNKVVCRSYDKFFNIEEREETKLGKLGMTLKFPVIGYKKYNGFLGLLSVYNDEWFIASKSTIEGDYKEYFNNILIEKKILTQNLKDFIKAQNVSLIFEVIDIKNDPHIIEYKENNVVLLDIIKNKFQYEKFTWDELHRTSLQFSLKLKSKELEFNSYADFYEWYIDNEGEYKKFPVLTHEGFVFEDTNGFMVKYKTTYYRLWKKMRSVKQSLAGGHNVKLAMLTTPYENNIYAFFKTLSREQLKSSIIELRNEYLKVKK